MAVCFFCHVSFFHFSLYKSIPRRYCTKLYTVLLFINYIAIFVRNQYQIPQMTVLVPQMHCSVRACMENSYICQNIPRSLSLSSKNLSSDSLSAGSLLTYNHFCAFSNITVFQTIPKTYKNIFLKEVLW